MMFYLRWLGLACFVFLLSVSISQVRAGAPVDVESLYGHGSDHFADAVSVVEGSGYSASTNLVSYTSEPGESFLSYLGARGQSAWWKWTPSQNCYATFSTQYPDWQDSPLMDTTMTVYTGNALPSLTFLIFNDDAGFPEEGSAGRLSRVTFNARAGTTYYIAVDAHIAAQVGPENAKVRLNLRTVPLKRRVHSATFTNGNVRRSGHLAIALTDEASFTGKLSMGGETEILKGVFGLDGLYHFNFSPKFPPQALPIGFTIDLTGEGTLTVHHANQGGMRTGFYAQSVFNQATPVPSDGQHNMRFVMTNQDIGFARAMVSRTGIVTGTGFTPDGVAFTFGSALHLWNDSGTPIFSMPVYRSTARGAGVFLGTLNLAMWEGAAFISGMDCLFVRPPAASPRIVFYPDGVADSFEVFGGRYVKPAPRQRALGFCDASGGNGWLDIAESGQDGDLNFNGDFTISTANKLSVAPMDVRLNPSLNPATGLLSGSYVDSTGKKRTLRGILLAYQGDSHVAGHIAGPYRMSLFNLYPAAH